MVGSQSETPNACHEEQSRLSKRTREKKFYGVDCRIRFRRDPISCRIDGWSVGPKDLWRFLRQDTRTDCWRRRARIRGRMSFRLFFSAKTSSNWESSTSAGTAWRPYRKWSCQIFGNFIFPVNWAELFNFGVAFTIFRFLRNLRIGPIS
jgi:hypothetical protein